MPPTKLPSFAKEPIFVTLSDYILRACQKPRLAKNLWVSVKKLDKFIVIEIKSSSKISEKAFKHRTH